MLRFLTTALGAAVLGGASLAALPASAAPLATAIAPIAEAGGHGIDKAQYYYGPPRHYRRHYGPRYRHYGPRYYYGPPRIVAPFPFAPPPRYYGPPRYYW